MENFDCNIVANNNADFVIADNIKQGKIPVLIAGAESGISTMSFDINSLRKDNQLFDVSFKKTMQNINSLEKNDEYISNVLSLTQGFIEKRMPLCKPELLDERTACIFDDEPFSYMVKNNLCMCAERAAIAQYICQEAGIKSYVVNSFAHIENVTKEPGLHAYVMYEDKGKMYVYDPANPRKDNRPRILDCNMDKTTFDDFIEATNQNQNDSNRKNKHRVGFKCVDNENGQRFLYLSMCGEAGKNISPRKLREMRTAKNITTIINQSSSEKPSA